MARLFRLLIALALLLGGTLAPNAAAAAPGAGAGHCASMAMDGGHEPAEGARRDHTAPAVHACLGCAMAVPDLTAAAPPPLVGATPVAPLVAVLATRTSALDPPPPRDRD